MVGWLEFHAYHITKILVSCIQSGFVTAGRKIFIFLFFAAAFAAGAVVMLLWNAILPRSHFSARPLLLAGAGVVAQPHPCLGLRFGKPGGYRPWKKRREWRGKMDEHERGGAGAVPGFVAEAVGKRRR